ncbi:MAG: hypothetical protein J0I20_32085 [Chloroflexi bacterium]|nr:hypothetical protein [Chloroflexota bacterium]
MPKRSPIKVPMVSRVTRQQGKGQVQTQPDFEPEQELEVAGPEKALDPRDLSRNNLNQAGVLHLQRTIGNQAVMRLLNDYKVSRSQTAAIQRAYEPALVTEVAHLHGEKGGKVNTGSSGSVGPKLKAGTSIEVDKSITLQGDGADWIKGKTGATEGYIRPGKYFIKSLVNVPATFGDSESDTVGSISENSEKVGGVSDTVGSGIEMGDIKSKQGGVWKDTRGDNSPMAKTETAKSGMDIGAGAMSTFSGIFGMIGSAKAVLNETDGWKRLEGGFGFAESLVKTGSGIEKIVDSIAKASGSKSGVGKSDVAGKFLSAIGDGLSAVKSSAMGLISLYKLYKSQSSEKPKEALATFKMFTEAASSAAKVAKSAYDIIGNGIPMSVVYAVPGLSIGVSAINILIRLWDAITAGKTKEKMKGNADPLRVRLATDLGVAPPDPDADHPAFDKDRRGTFPAYKTYYRTKKVVKDGLRAVKDKADTLSTGLGAHVRGKPRRQKAVLNRANKALIAAIDTHVTVPEIKSKLKTKVGTPATADEFNTNAKLYISNIVTLMDEYEFADKMGEINQKRQVGGWTDVILELVSIAGDIVTIVTSASGIGAAVGQGIKAASAGYKAVHSGAKFIQKQYRDRGTGDDKKSTKNKHAEYVGHAKFIYEQLAALDPSQPTAQVQAGKVIEYIKATGVNYGMWLSLMNQPGEQVSMLVEAMKKR